jgi:hypothetical protein
LSDDDVRVQALIGSLLSDFSGEAVKKTARSAARAVNTFSRLPYIFLPGALAGAGFAAGLED